MRQTKDHIRQREHITAKAMQRTCACGLVCLLAVPATRSLIMGPAGREQIGLDG